MILLYPSLIHFKGNEADRKNFAPRSIQSSRPWFPAETCTFVLTSAGSCHMFYSQRVVDIPDGKPKWTGLNDSSDLMADSPPEAYENLKKKKKRKEME